MVSLSLPAVLLFLALNSAAACWAGPATYAYAPKSDGTIARYRVDDLTGKLNPLPGVTDVGADRLPVLVLSVDRRFLYAHWGIGGEPTSYEDVLDGVRLSAEKSGTQITVLRVGPKGDLVPVQTLSLPIPIGELEPHPAGRFAYGLTATKGALLLAVAKDGRLSLKGRYPVISGMGTFSHPGERDDWDLTFSPDGAYLYNFLGDGFIDHAENVLQRYLVHRTTGKLTTDGRGWNSGKRMPATVAEDPGRVWAFAGRTAFVEGFEGGLWVCAVDGAGRILSNGSRLALKPQTKGKYILGQRIAAHPSVPVVYYRGSVKDRYTVWRVIAPGKIRGAGTFATAFPDQGGVTPYIEPGGRFFYEVASKPGGLALPNVGLAVFALEKTGTRVRRTVPPYTLPNSEAAQLVFVTAPAK